MDICGSALGLYSDAIDLPRQCVIEIEHGKARVSKPACFAGAPPGAWASNASNSWVLTLFDATPLAAVEWLPDRHHMGDFRS